MKGDNIAPWSEYAKAEWDRMTWTSADPLHVEPPDQLTAERSRDTVLVCVAGMAIIAIVAFVAGTRV